MEKTALINRIYDFVYNKLGHRGIKWLLFLCFFALHTAISAFAYLPSIEPGEFTAAAVANMFLGGDWSSVMSRSNYSYGFLQSLLYVPVMLITKDPFIQYRMMVIINGAAVSFIPILAYSSALILGAKKPWQALSIAVCAGGWISCMLHSKFIWSETASLVFPFLILYILLKSDGSEKRAGKRIFSLILGLVSGICWCAGQRLFSLILAVIFTVLVSKFVFKRRAVNLPFFFSAFTVSFAASIFFNYIVRENLWGITDPSLLNNTLEGFFSGLSETLSNVGPYRFFISLISGLYYYVCASWGIGALFFSAFLTVIVRFVLIKKQKKRREKTAAVIFGENRIIFMLFCFSLTIFILFTSVCYRFGAADFETNQSVLLFGRYLDGIIPFAVMVVLVFAYTEELQLSEIFGAVVISGIIYLLFFFTGRSIILKAESAAMSPMLGLYPAMFEGGSSSLVTSTGLLAAISSSLCILAIFIVIICCAKKLRRIVISGAVAILGLYSLIFGIVFYLPAAYSESIEKNAPYEELSSHIFNSSEAPSVVAYDCSRSCVMMLQYLNQNITVYSVSDVSQIKEDTFVIVPADRTLSFENQERIPLFPLAELSAYRIYAYGERAAAYAKAQNS